MTCSCSLTFLNSRGFGFGDLQNTRPILIQEHPVSLPPNGTNHNCSVMARFERTLLPKGGRWSGKTTVLSVYTSDGFGQPTCTFLTQTTTVHSTTHQHIDYQQTSELTQCTSYQSERTIELINPASSPLPWPRIPAPLVPEAVILHSFSR